MSLSISLAAYPNPANSPFTPKFGSQHLQTYSQFSFNRTACFLFSFYSLLNLYCIPSAKVDTLRSSGSVTLAVILRGVVPPHRAAASVTLWGERYSGRAPRNASMMLWCDRLLTSLLLPSSDYISFISSTANSVLPGNSVSSI